MAIAAGYEPGPTVSRRHAVGATTARGVLLTVLGELVLPDNGAAWTSAFIEVLGRVGVEEKAARQALMRTAAEGWLSAERVGRRSRWHLTSAAEQMLTEGAERIYGFAGHAPDWDGRWLLVLARVPESDRGARHLLRTRLSWAGLGSLAPGTWISPHPARAAEAARVLADAGVADDAHLFVASRAELGDPRQMVRQAWDLDAIEELYAAFIDSFAPATATDAGVGDARGADALGADALGADALADQVALVHAWRRFPLLDPALPRELLPPRWSGLRAAELFARRRAQLAPAGLAEWRRLNG